MKQIRSNKEAFGRKFHCHTNLLAFAVVIFGCAFSAPVIACICRDADSLATGVRAAEYDEIFSGLVISTERIDEPVAAAAVSGDEVVEDSGYWIRSRILVLRIWRGAPPTVAEVWTPVVANCDSPPITGSYFVALVQSEIDRDVARYSLCDRAWKAAATEGRGAFAFAGIALTAAAICAVAIALLLLVKVVRRRSLSG
jgi:hypothetical protein